MYIKIYTNRRSQPFAINMCRNGFFLRRGRWEAFVITFRNKSLWFFRKKEYAQNWPVASA